jgi:hypothetical protein
VDGTGDGGMPGRAGKGRDVGRGGSGREVSWFMRWE